MSRGRGPAISRWTRLGPSSSRGSSGGRTFNLGKVVLEIGSTRLDWATVTMTVIEGEGVRRARPDSHRGHGVGPEQRSPAPSSRAENASLWATDGAKRRSSARESRRRSCSRLPRIGPRCIPSTRPATGGPPSSRPIATAGRSSPSAPRTRPSGTRWKSVESGREPSGGAFKVPAWTERLGLWMVLAFDSDAVSPVSFSSFSTSLTVSWNSCEGPSFGLGLISSSSALRAFLTSASLASVAVLLLRRADQLNQVASPPSGTRLAGLEPRRRACLSSWDRADGSSPG